MPGVFLVEVRKQTEYHWIGKDDARLAGFGFFDAAFFFGIAVSHMDNIAFKLERPKGRGMDPSHNNQGSRFAGQQSLPGAYRK